MAEGGGLLNRYTLSRRIEGSNPSVSAIFGVLAAGLQSRTTVSAQASRGPSVPDFSIDKDISLRWQRLARAKKFTPIYR